MSTSIEGYLTELRKSASPQVSKVWVFDLPYRKEEYPTVIILVPENRSYNPLAYCISKRLAGDWKRYLSPSFPPHLRIVVLTSGILAVNTLGKKWTLPLGIDPHRIDEALDQLPRQHLVFTRHEPDRLGRSRDSVRVVSEAVTTSTPRAQTSKKTPAGKGAARGKGPTPLSALRSISMGDGLGERLQGAEHVQAFGYSYVLVKVNGYTLLVPARHAEEPPLFIILEARASSWRSVLPEHYPYTKEKLRLPDGILALQSDHGRWLVPEVFSPEAFTEMAGRFRTVLTIPSGHTRGVTTPCLRVEWFRAADLAPKDPPRTDPEIPVIRLNWEILPPDYHPRQDVLLTATPGTVKERQERELLMERLDFLTELGPICWYRGIPMEGGREYRAAEFSCHVVAECPLLGNVAIVADKATWRDVLSRTKSYAKEHGTAIYHKGDWKRRLLRALGR